MGRPSRLDPEVGGQVLDLREQGVAWKEICARYGAGRTRLTQLMKRARFRRDGGPVLAAVSPEKDVHEHLDAGQDAAGPSYDGRLRRKARLLGAPDVL